VPTTPPMIGVPPIPAPIVMGTPAELIACQTPQGLDGVGGGERRRHRIAVIAAATVGVLVAIGRIPAALRRRILGSARLVLTHRVESASTACAKEAPIGKVRSRVCRIPTRSCSVARSIIRRATVVVVIISSAVIIARTIVARAVIAAPAVIARAIVAASTTIGHSMYALMGVESMNSMNYFFLRIIIASSAATIVTTSSTVVASSAIIVATGVCAAAPFRRGRLQFPEKS
jgi:hypothetical protein